MRVNQTRAWNTGNGSPDSICFTVDRPGVTLAGVSVYGGLGNYEYSLELLHDVRVSFYLFSMSYWFILEMNLLFEFHPKK